MSKKPFTGSLLESSSLTIGLFESIGNAFEVLIDSLSEKNEEIPPELIIKLINLVGDEYDEI